MKRFRTTDQSLQSLLNDAKSIRKLDLIQPEAYQRGSMIGVSKEEIKQMRMQSREQLRDLTAAWQQQMFRRIRIAGEDDALLAWSSRMPA